MWSNLHDREKQPYTNKAAKLKESVRRMPQTRSKWKLMAPKLLIKLLKKKSGGGRQEEKEGRKGRRSCIFSL